MKTNREYLMSVPDNVLAELLIQIYHKKNNFGERTRFYETSDGISFESWEAAIYHEIKWLNEKYE